MIISDLHWSFAMRAVFRGDNLMIRGDAGCGKTLLAKKLGEVFPERQFFYFNMGAMQDPRSSLIGNTHFTKKDGTFLVESVFVRAIQTEAAIILLDEISRLHPEGSNILMTVTDKLQRYLRIDESAKTPLIHVAKGVTFIATANVGNEYTGTRTIDRALLDRFTVLMMDTMTVDAEKAYLAMCYPTLAAELITCIAGVADETRKNMRSENPALDTSISTRMTLEIAALCVDGFSFLEAAELCIYPFQSDAGGGASPRTAIKQIIENFVGSTAPTTLYNHPPLIIPEGMTPAEWMQLLNDHVTSPIT